MIRRVNVAFENRFSIPILNNIICKGHAFRFSSWVFQEQFVNDMSRLIAMVLLLGTLGSVRNGSGIL